MVLDAQNDLLAGHIKDLTDLFNVEIICMLRTGRETDARLQDLAGLLNFLENRQHIGNMVHEVKNPPDINMLGKFTNRKTNDILRVGPVAEKIDTPTKRLEHCVRHLFAQQFKFQEGIDLLPQNIDMY